ncbi:unnamed protein product [Cochlearia groenlandica]
MRSIVVTVLTLVLMLFTTVANADTKPRLILVGGSVGSWNVPNSPNNNNTLNLWAENNRFKVGDILVWKYDLKVDSVLQVTKEDYECCNTSNPIKQYNNGDTKFELEKSGPYYFISGAPGNCDKGEKIVIVVLSERNSGGGGGGGNGGDTPNSPPSPIPTPAPTATHNAAAVGLAVANGLWIAFVIGLVAMA